MTPSEVPRIDFSLKREVFFVVIGAIVGAITMIIPKTIFEVEMGLPYYISWIAFGHIVGVYSSESVIAGIGIHLVTAASIGIIIGVFLYKSNILNISKISNGLVYGIITGFTVFIIFFIPVQQFILAPEIARTLTETDPAMTVKLASEEIERNFVLIMVGSIIMHQVFGLTLGAVSSFLSVKFGSRYRCSICDISFSRIDSYQKHNESVHGAKPITQTRILILGGGFAGVEVLRELQRAFQDDVSLDITLVSRENFFLFTPMLPEVSAGTIETRHILTPIRTFCKRARFYEANVDSIDLDKKQVVISHTIGKGSEPRNPRRSHVLNYDYLVIALGSETNFFGLKNVAENAFTMKNIGDAIVLRNHIINMLEQADIEQEDCDLRKTLMTFVVVGGGFSGVETVGELNDFVRDSINHFYHNIAENKNDIRIILISSSGGILPEVTDDLAEFALKKLRESGIEVILNARVEGSSPDSVWLNDKTLIHTNTLIWAGGVIPESGVSNLPCPHDKGGRILADKYLEVTGHSGVYVLGDCASVNDPNTGKPYPPTAQHAVREAKIVSHNIISSVRNKISDKKQFDYKTKGIMALIGKNNGVGILLGYKVHGFLAWWLWRSYYLGNVPTWEKKLRVMVDWFIDLFFHRDVTRLKTFEEKEPKTGDKQKEIFH
jgi:NADH dehydrogenase FAD-containing subunit